MKLQAARAVVDQGRLGTGRFLDPVLLGSDIATLGLDRDQDAACARRGGSE